MSYLFQNTRFDDFDSIKNWNVSKVVNMDYMFGNNPNLVDLTPLRNWITTNLTTIGSIFRNDTGITSLNGLQNWNVSKVTNFSQGNDNNNSYSEGAFEGLSSLTDASAINGWDIKSDAHFEKMFKNTPVHPTFTKYAGTWGSDGTFTITQ